MKITPSWVATFETNIQTLIQDAWARVAADLMWEKVMGVKKSATGRELFFWLIETAKIQKEQQGGNKRFDDLATTFFEIVNENAGIGLRLTKNEIEDNQMANKSPPLDYAASWARQVGGHAGYWPQQLAFDLIINGQTGLAYDALAYFAINHLTNPALAGGPTFANLFTGAAASTPATDPNDAIYPGAVVINTGTLDARMVAFTSAVAYIRALKQPNGLPRRLKPRYAIGGPDLQKPLFEILDTKYFGSGAGSTENVVSRYGIEPLIVPELTVQTGWAAGDFLIACEFSDAEGGPLVFQDRSPYVLSSYQAEAFAELQRRKEFEWSLDGRNAGAYGHPYLLFKCRAT